MIRAIPTLRAFAWAVPLHRNERGGALVIGAVALFVILAMMGGGLDLGRAYLTRSRLQQACDAGVLASRGALAQGWDTGAHAAADAMFDANFPAGSYGSANLSRVFTHDNEKTVSGTASAEVPTSLMRLFGFKMIPVSATCGAQTQMANADIMFVLDMTTSMARTNDGDSMTRIAALKQAVISFYTTIESNKVGSGAQVRYGFVPFVFNVNVGGLLKPEWLADQWTYQSRQTIMGYQAAGGIDERRYLTVEPTGTKSVGSKYTSPSVGEAQVCPFPPADNFTDTGDVQDLMTDYVPDPVTGEETRLFKYHRTQNGSDWNWWIDNNGICHYEETVYDNYTTYNWYQAVKWPVDDARRTYETWRYAPITYDVSSVKTVGANGFLTGTGLITVPIGHALIHDDRTVAWRGCIEERQTVTTPIDGTTGIPAGALDLDIDLVPDSRPETKWGPSLPHLVFTHNPNTNLFSANTATIIDAGRPPDGDFYNVGDGTVGANVINAMTTANGYWPGSEANTIRDRNKNGVIEPDLADPNKDEGDSEFAFCPAPARRLAEIDVSTLSDYMDKISQRLGRFTHHDIGMIWGARLLSPDGLFKDDNRFSKNGGPITRHLILMTDGDATYTEFNLLADSGYGLEPLDNKRRPAGTLNYGNGAEGLDGGRKALAPIVAGRFQAICKAARAKFTVWVVAFGVELSDNLRNCASPGAAFQANNAAELNQRFLDIAGKIAALRITK